MQIHRLLLSKIQIFVVIIVLQMNVFLFLSCSGKSDAGENNKGMITPAVEAVQSRTGSLPLTQRLSGIVEAKNQIEIYPEISAIITDVFVKNGDFVKKGDALLKLRDKEFSERLKQANAGYQIALAQLKQAKARMNEINNELARTQKLADQGLTSTTDLETVQTRAISAEADVNLAEARLEQAQATVEERNESLAQTTIKAPISGTIGNRDAETGMLVSTNRRLFTLGQLEQVRVKVILTDRMLNYISEGQRAEIANVNSADGIMTASLSRISPFLNPVTHSTEAEIDMQNPDGDLKPGMFVTVDIFYGESENATLIPLSALYENPLNGLTGVYVTDATFNSEKIVSKGGEKSVGLSDAVDFEFVPVNIIAKGRMEAGVNGIEENKWVVTIGQNLLGGENGSARVRPVKWAWVEKLQHLQRENLMENLIKNQAKNQPDSSNKNLGN